MGRAFRSGSYETAMRGPCSRCLQAPPAIFEVQRSAAQFCHSYVALQQLHPSPFLATKPRSVTLDIRVNIEYAHFHAVGDRMRAANRTHHLGLKLEKFSARGNSTKPIYVLHHACA